MKSATLNEGLGITHELVEQVQGFTVKNKPGAYEKWVYCNAPQKFKFKGVGKKIQAPANRLVYTIACF